LRETGFRLRLRWGFRQVGLAKAGKMAGWVLVYVLANQAAFLVITRLAYASRYGGTHGGAFTVYTTAFILVLLPHSVVAVSVITALLPQMSRNALEGRLPDVAADLAGGFKLAAVLLVPAALAGVALGPLVGAVLFAHRSLSLSTARLIGATLAAYSVSLLPFSAFQLQLRAFYALQDTRTPALVNILLAVINVVADAVLFLVLPAREQVVGLALGYSLSYFVGYAWFAVLLQRRLGTLPGAHVTRTIVRLTVAAALAVGAAYLVAHAVTRALGLGWAASLAALVAGGAVGVPLYVALILRMRVPEVRQVAAVARVPWKM
jgi:putative peptidoglycan lipid II flippase